MTPKSEKREKFWLLEFFLGVYFLLVGDRNKFSSFEFRRLFFGLNIWEQIMASEGSIRK